MILEIQHETTIGYAEPVSEWLCELRMEPVSDAAQRCHSFRISLSDCGSRAGQLDAACSRRGHDEQTMTPGGTHVPMHAYVDGFGNRVHHFNMLRPPALVRILAASVVETDHGGAGPMASQATFPATTPGPEWDVPLEALDYLPLRGPVRHTPLLDPVLVQLRPVPWMRVGMWVCQVAEWIRGRFEYARDVTDATSPIDHLLEHGKGVCQDFTHLMIAVLRSFGVPARYVSGYIHRENRDSQSHAWCEVWLPDIGWIGFDPTNGCPVNDHFVKTAVGRDYTDVPPNKGTYRGGGAETINVRVATRTLSRLPSISWHEQLAPLDAPAHAVLRTMPDWTHDAAVAQQ